MPAEVLHRYLLGMGRGKVHQGGSADSLAHQQSPIRCGQRSLDNRRAHSHFCLGPWVSCLWLPEDRAEVWCEDKVRKTQLRRHKMGKRSQREGAKCEIFEVWNVVWMYLRKLGWRARQQGGDFVWFACVCLCLEGLWADAVVATLPWCRPAWGMSDDHLRAAKTPLCFIHKGRSSFPPCSCC